MKFKCATCGKGNKMNNEGVGEIIFPIEQTI
jgi:hypothetical protein